jgi:putative chitinase
MAEQYRGPSRKIGKGPYVGIITNHLDPTYMGALEVMLVKGTTGSIEESGTTAIVQYLSPFYGVSSIAFEGNDSSNWQHVQKSYGMWMVPPDVGTSVLCIFIDGDINSGFWIGCIPDRFANHMVPGFAASKFTEMTPAQEQKYGTRYVPVAEFLKRTQKLQGGSAPDAIGKPVHPFADRLLTQGLLLDTTRGVTSSSARREVPSTVFGISTPGPMDNSTNSHKGQIGYDSKLIAPVSRFGGSSFVMDDGDKLGNNELVRIRTRTGHQILLHNSKDLIYIANSKGTAWVELTSMGKIDIYAEDSVSIHTQNDFNFRADRDINLEAGRNLNINANGGIEMNCVDRFYLLGNKDAKIQFSGNFNLGAGDAIRMQSSTSFNLASGAAMRLGAANPISIGSGNKVIIAGTQIGLNTWVPTSPDAADPPTQLEKFSLPNRQSSAGWSNGSFYKASDITSIMQRVPTHEPWDHHESINPSNFTPERTNVQVNQPQDAPSGPTAPPGEVPINKNPVSKPLSGNASANEQYLQGVLVNAGITSPVKLAAWMSQCKVESAGFQALREYASGAEYEGRKDLGNVQAGDGVRFKGRGFIQLTGRDVYRKMTKYFNGGVDFEQQPEVVEQLEWASKSVLYFFNVYKPKGFKNKTMLQAYVDSDTFWGDCVSVSGLVNGGTNGLAKRQQYFAEYLAKFKADGVVPNGTVGTGSGGVLLDGSGKPVKSGA